MEIYFEISVSAIPSLYCISRSGWKIQLTGMKKIMTDGFAGYFSMSFAVREVFFHLTGKCGGKKKKKEQGSSIMPLHFLSLKSFLILAMMCDEAEQEESHTDGTFSSCPCVKGRRGCGRGRPSPRSREVAAKRSCEMRLLRESLSLCKYSCACVLSSFLPLPPNPRQFS